MGLGVGAVSGFWTNPGSKEAGGRRKDRNRPKAEVPSQALPPPRTRQ